MKTCIFIPTRNVRNEVVGLLERIPAAFGRSCAEVFVLDNASTDGTPEAVCERVGRGFPFPVRVYRNPVNLGYGGSQKVAYAHALRQGYDVVVMLHGDGQYPAHQVPDLVTPLADRHVGMAYGSRFLCQKERDETPGLRRFGVWALTILQNFATGLRLVEWYSGFRAFRCDALRTIPFQACDNDYYFDVQMILLLSMAGYSIAELPVSKKYQGNRSHINIYKFGTEVLGRLCHYPLVRCGLLPGRLYCTKHWPSLEQTRVPPPVHFLAEGHVRVVAASQQSI